MLLKTVKKFNLFDTTMQWYTLYLIYIIIVSTTMTPYVSKIVGTHMATHIIALYGIIKGVSKLLLPYIENTSLLTGVKGLIVITLLYPIGRVYLLVTGDEIVYVYVVWVAFVIHSVLLSVVAIKYNSYVIAYSRLIPFDKVQVVDSTLYTIVGLLAGILSMVLYIYSDTLPLYISLVFDIGGIVSLMYLYKSLVK